MKASLHGKALILLVTLGVLISSGCRNRAFGDESKVQGEGKDVFAEFYECSISGHKQEFAGPSIASEIDSVLIGLPPKFEVPDQLAKVVFSSKAKGVLFQLQNQAVDLYDRFGNPARISGSFSEPTKDGESADAIPVPILGFAIWFHNKLPGKTGHIDFEQGKLHQRSIANNMTCTPLKPQK